MTEKIRKIVTAALQELGIRDVDFMVEHPADSTHGDYSTNVALVLAKKEKDNPRELAQKIRTKIEERLLVGIQKVEVAGAGFINFRLSHEFFEERVAEVLQQAENFGRNTSLAGKKVMVEYTDPNPFKEFHIGHLMSNAIGESISRIIAFQGAEVKRANYQGDVGLHVAKAIWAFLHSDKKAYDELAGGVCYVKGNDAYESNEKAKIEIQEINKKIYDRSDKDINEVYDAGKKLSMRAFDSVYRKLGTAFDFFFFESDVAKIGAELVKKRIGDVFEISDGATVFKGEKYDPALHTRVFLNSQGLPTYEAKELGLAEKKEEAFPFDLSISITGNEIKEYFKVLRKAMEFVLPELKGKIIHVPHGMLRVPGGKMSSRKGNVITGERLIDNVKEMIAEKIKNREFSDNEREKVAEEVAIGAIKYSVLRQAIGGDIIFDFEKSISFEGDSGPYLQYTYARARSVLAKASEAGVKNHELSITDKKTRKENNVGALERLLYRFPEVVERAAKEFEPHHVATYLIETAGAFNNFYAHNKIIGSDEETYRLALTKAVSIVLKNGLCLLGIAAPEKM